MGRGWQRPGTHAYIQPPSPPHPLFLHHTLSSLVLHTQRDQEQATKFWYNAAWDHFPMSIRVEGRKIRACHSAQLWLSRWTSRKCQSSGLVPTVTEAVRRALDILWQVGNKKKKQIMPKIILKGQFAPCRSICKNVYYASLNTTDADKFLFLCIQKPGCILRICICKNKVHFIWYSICELSICFSFRNGSASTSFSLCKQMYITAWCWKFWGGDRQYDYLHRQPGNHEWIQCSCWRLHFNANICLREKRDDDYNNI